ncbi:DUF885 domain-containing protein [[Clostridium] innocuum]|uniref:DUF885 domain-containing protein n=1 Tax=Clostridium innocuum TaxID=1522 RepID=UPI0021476132|nr:DUF885 domain-containing protein [[Clostridium] innocuum]MCR0274137.1 DUF885 domain-containing protein [[Clostridium] innocuum]
MNVKKITLLMLSAVMAFSFTGCSKKDSGEEQKKFDEFMKQEFVESMEQSYPNTHIILENPKDYGVDTSKTKVQIDKELNETTMKENKELNEKSAKAFKEFDRNTLSDEQKETYDIYSYMLDYTTEMNDSKFDYMSMPLESMTGMHTQLPTLFSDWTLRNEQDVKDVITLMKSVRPYMDSILAYTKKQEEKGTLMLDIKSVKEYCEKVVKEDVNSSVLTGLNESIDNLKLGDDKTKQYKAELKKAFQEYFLPAYSDIIKTMKELDSSKNNTLGLSHMKNGKEYYELLFKQATGTDKSIEDIKKELNSMSRSSLLAVQSVISKNKNLYDEYVNGKIKTKYKDFESMLKDLDKDIKDDFPSVGTLNYRIRPIGEDLASGGVAAYFNIPALDGTTPKQIRVNMLEDALNVQSLETFSTVAHEGIPGHMYQIAYAYKNVKDPWRNSMASFLGYTEGYATYTELYALKYLDGVSADAVKLQQNMVVYQDCLIALADIGIHYEGWTKEDLSNFLEENGLGVSDVSDFYNQLQANPTAFLSYYVGYVQIANLKKDAQEELKDKFNDRDFHEAILKSGAAPFHVVEENVKDYIESAK